MLRNRINEHHLSLTIDLPDDPLPVLGDSSRLQQIQVNLLNNAIKYTPEGGEIEIRAFAEEDQAVVTVRDSGVGIAAEMLDSVFDLFTQSDTTLDRSDGGMGVGLTLVRALTEFHGGSVLANSNGLGQGSEFTVRVPLTSELIANELNVDGDRTVRGNRIVLVEDNKDARETLKTLLEMDGYEVETAADGVAGVELVRRKKPDIAFVDIGLPGIDGLQVAQRLRELFPKDALYLVATTGYGLPNDVDAALAAGFDAHVTKPLRPEVLANVLSSRVSV